MEKGLLGNTIRQARIDNKYTQEELAEKIGITATHLKHIESEHRKPSIEVLFSLASELHISGCFTPAAFRRFTSPEKNSRNSIALKFVYQ